MPGPRIQPVELNQAMEAIFEQGGEKPEFIVASGSLPPGVPKEFYAGIADRAAAENIKFVLDTSRAALRHAADTGHVFLLKPNQKELSQLREVPEQDAYDTREIAGRLIESGRAKVVIVSLG